MISKYNNDITAGTRYPEKFIDQCAEVCSWVRGYDETLVGLGKDKLTIPKLSSFLKVEKNECDDSTTRYTKLDELYKKCNVIEHIMGEIEVLSRKTYFNEMFIVNIVVHGAATHGVMTSLRCKLCDEVLMVRDPRNLIRVADDHYTHHIKLGCKHVQADQHIVWDLSNDYGDLEIWNQCKVCGKVLEGYKANIEDIKELLFETLKTPHPNITKMNIEKNND